MKKINLLLMVAASAAIATGCNKQSDTINQNTDTGSYSTNAVSASVSNVWQSTTTGASNAWDATKSGATNAWQATKNAGSNAWEKTKEMSTNAWDKTKSVFGYGSTNEVSTNFFNYDFSQKDTFVAEAKAGLDNFDQKISNLTDKVNAAPDAAKSEAQQKLQDVKDKRTDLDQKYDGVKNAAADNWNDAKSAFEKSYTDVNDAIKSTWSSVNGNL